MTDNFDDANAITLGSSGAGASHRVLRVGDVIGGSYRLKSLLGRGGMGYVFCAEHTIIKRDYALKMLAPEQLNEASRNRFEVEGKAIANLEHPNIVKVYNMGLDGGDCPFYVMDLLDGESLAHYIHARAKIPFRRWLDIFIQIASGLGYAHSKGIVHRDVKPSNIILLESAKDITVKIVDFGIAKLLPSADLRTQSQTATGEVFGSPYYMSPEQCMGKNVDLRSDIYSLGCTWYEALCGRPPYSGSSALQTIMMHQNAEIPSIVADCHDRDWPEAVDDVLAKMMAKRPEHRYQSMQQVVHDLERMKAGKIVGKVESVGSRSPAIPELSKTADSEEGAHKRLIVTGAIVATALLVVAVSGTVLWRHVMAPKTIEDKLLDKQETHPLSDPNDSEEDAVRARINATAPEEGVNLFVQATKSAIPEEDKKKMPIVRKAFAACRRIESHIVTRPDGKVVRRFVFPSWPVGHVLTSAPEDLEAKDTVDVSATLPASLQIGEGASRLVFQAPEIAAKIKPDEFCGLWLRGHKVSGVTSSLGGLPSETNHSIPILEAASRWPKLERIVLQEIGAPTEVLRVLDKCKHLKVLQMRQPIINTRDMLKAPFVGRLQELELVEIVQAGVLYPALAQSKNLTKLSLVACEVDPQDLAVLAKSTTLKTFILREEDFAALIPALTKMPHVRSLTLYGGVVRPQEIRAITACPNIDELILDRRSYSPSEVERCRHLERKVRFLI